MDFTAFSCPRGIAIINAICHLYFLTLLLIEILNAHLPSHSLRFGDYSGGRCQGSRQDAKIPQFFPLRLCALELKLVQICRYWMLDYLKVSLKNEIIICEISLREGLMVLPSSALKLCPAFATATSSAGTPVAWSAASNICDCSIGTN